MANPALHTRRDAMPGLNTWGRARLLLALGGTFGLLLAIAPGVFLNAQAQTGEQGTITLKADVQEANAVTGVITARGNVQIEYPTRDIVATSAQAQYFSEENRMILSGNVVVLQEGNRLEAETVTYLIDEGRFIALPQPNDQVETTYILRSSPPNGTGDGANPGETPSGAVPPAQPDAALNLSPVN